MYLATARSDERSHAMMSVVHLWQDPFLEKLVSGQLRQPTFVFRKKFKIFFHPKFLSPPIFFLLLIFSFVDVSMPSWVVQKYFAPNFFHLHFFHWAMGEANHDPMLPNILACGSFLKISNVFPAHVVPSKLEHGLNCYFLPRYNPMLLLCFAIKHREKPENLGKGNCLRKLSSACGLLLFTICVDSCWAKSWSKSLVSPGEVWVIDLQHLLFRQGSVPHPQLIHHCWHIPWITKTHRNCKDMETKIKQNAPNKNSLVLAEMPSIEKNNGRCICHQEEWNHKK